MHQAYDCRHAILRPKVTFFMNDELGDSKRHHLAWHRRHVTFDRGRTERFSEATVSCALGNREPFRLNVSLWNLSERDIGLWLALLVLALIPLWWGRYRRLVSELFAGREGDDTALQEMRQKLEVVNEECSTHIFSATRVATVYLHENPISLVYGYVVPRVGEGGTGRYVFALADQNQADWMRRYSDVFEPAFSASLWSIFWVKVPALVRLIRRGR